MNVRTIFSVALWCLIGFSMTACSGSQSKDTSSAPDQTQATSAPKPASAADSCNKQVHVKLKTVAGRITLPPCAGFQVTVDYPATNERSPRDATIDFGTVNVHKLMPPPNYGDPFFFMSITSNVSLRDSHAVQMTFSHKRDQNWNPDHKYTYSRYENGSGPFSAQELSVLECKHKICSGTMMSPLAGSFSSDTRIDLQFVRDPGLINR